MNKAFNRVPKYKWARVVKELDGNVCVCCGSKERLHAHHIIPQSAAPDKVDDIENGITLCAKCHHIAHNMGWHRSPEYEAIAAQLNPNTQMGRMNAIIQEYADSTVLIALPEGRKATIEARANEKGESVNGYINGLIRADVGLSEDEWKKGE